MKKGIVILSLLLAASSASASTFTIACPAANTLNFVKQHEGPPTWNSYRARGIISIVSGKTTTFEVSGDTDADKANHFEWATFYRGDLNNDLICNYAGTNANSEPADSVLSDHTVQPQLKDCHFKNGDAYECDGSLHSCELVCKN